MRNLGFRVLILAVAWAVVVPVGAGGGDKSGDSTKAKKVLVELYSSQGCDSCLPASDLMGKLAGLGYGPDQVVPLNFHVDYFNTPWVDPYSDASFSQRQLSYNQVKGRSDLYFTPLMMVDGRFALLGSNRPKALVGIKQARAEPAGVTLDLNLDGKGSKKTVVVTIAPKVPEAVGRDLLIGVALTEEPVSTKILSGENAGKTLVEHHVVRRFDHKFVKLDPSKPQTLTFAVELPAGGDASRFGVAVFAQDRANGNVHQADAIPWTRDLPVKVGARTNKPRRKASAWNWGSFGFDPLMGATGAPASPAESADSPGFLIADCPSCGTLGKLPLVGAGASRSGEGGSAPRVASC